MNSLPFSELKFKPCETPSDDIQHIYPLFWHLVQDRLGWGLGLPWGSGEGAITQGCPILWHQPANAFHRHYIFDTPTPALPPVSLLQEKPLPPIHVMEARNLAAILDFLYLYPLHSI